MKDRNQEAVTAIKWFRGNQYDPSEDIAEIQNDNEEQRINSSTLKEALSRPASRRAFLMAMGLMFFQQLSGINAVIFYSEPIFRDADTGIDPKIGAIIIGVVQVVTTFIASLVVDRLGRRMLLLLSDALMAICTILLGVYFYIKENGEGDSASNLNWLPIASMSIFIVAFSFGFGPVPWMMVGGKRLITFPF